MEFGVKVRDYVSKRLEDAASIKLTNIRKTNTKLIAQVIVDGKDLGDELVEMGYASEEYGFWKPYYCSALTAVQAGQQLFNQDPEMKWETAPKPRLTEKSYREDYLNDNITLDERYEWVSKKEFVTTEEEPLFDAADVLRMGKDLFIQQS